MNLINITQCSEILGINKETLRSRIRDIWTDFPKSKIINKQKMYKKSEVIEFKKTHPQKIEKRKSISNNHMSTFPNDLVVIFLSGNFDRHDIRIEHKIKLKQAEISKPKTQTVNLIGE